MGAGKAAIARRGLSLAAVQEAIAIAIGGRDAGFIEGDRHFDIVVRHSGAERNNIDVLKNIPVALPEAAPGTAATMMPLRAFTNLRFSEGPNQISRDHSKRRVVVTANARGRDLGSLVEEAQAKVVEQVKLPPGYWLTWGGQFDNMQAAQHRLFVVVPSASC